MDEGKVGLKNGTCNATEGEEGNGYRKSTDEGEGKKRLSWREENYGGVCQYEKMS